MSEFKCPVCGSTLTVSAREVKTQTVQDVKKLFPEDLKNLLSFEDFEDYIKIKPRQFLGTDIFSQVATTVRDAGGDYYSAGKESHFRIPK